MKRLLVWLFASCLLLTLAGCKSDPNLKKQKFYQSGLKYLEKKQYTEAAIDLQGAVQIDPQYADAHYQLSKAYMGLANWQLALQELQRTVELRPTDMQAQYDLGSMYLGMRDYSDAEQVAMVMLEKAPENADGHALMANIKTGVIFFTEPKATGLDMNGNRNLAPLLQVP